jgi:hypothetical protein
MKILRSIFSGSGQGLKDWVVSLQRYFFQDKDYDSAMYEFKDPYQDLHYIHDTEMERLVKAIEDMKGDDRHYYQ